jgi:tripartite-type tricarboxylate transporter receptor subunit TctC
MLKLAGRFIVASLALGASAALAQSYPNKPVRVLIPFGAGGVTDVVARTFSDEISKRLGQPFVAENRTGAGGGVAANALKNSAPDGYTLYGGSITPFHPVFIKDGALDGGKEFQPISNHGFGEQFIYVRSNLGVNTMKELIDRAKTTRIKHGSLATTQHMLLSLVAKQMKWEYENIPYKTTDQVVTAILANDVDIVLTSIPGWQPHVDSGKLKTLVSLSAQRSPFQPQTPTVKEAGGDLVFHFNLGMWAPRGVPRDVVGRLNAATFEAAKAPALLDKMKAFGMVPQPTTPEEQLKVFEREIGAYMEAAKAIGYQPQ